MFTGSARVIIFSISLYHRKDSERHLLVICDVLVLERRIFSRNRNIPVTRSSTESHAEQIMWPEYCVLPNDLLILFANSRVHLYQCLGFQCHENVTQIVFVAYTYLYVNGDNEISKLRRNVYSNLYKQHKALKASIYHIWTNRLIDKSSKHATICCKFATRKEFFEEKFCLLTWQTTTEIMILWSPLCCLW